MMTGLHHRRCDRLLGFRLAGILAAFLHMHRYTLGRARFGMANFLVQDIMGGEYAWEPALGNVHAMGNGMS